MTNVREHSKSKIKGMIRLTALLPLIHSLTADDKNTWRPPFDAERQA